MKKKNLIQVCSEFYRQQINWLPNWQFKKKRRLFNTLKVSHRLGQEKLAENRRASPFNEDLSNETTFSLINVARQYL